MTGFRYVSLLFLAMGLPKVVFAQVQNHPLKSIHVEQRITEDKNRWTCPILEMKFTFESDENIVDSYIHQDLIGFTDSTDSLSYWNKMISIETEDGKTQYRQIILLPKVEDQHLLKSGNINVSIHTKTHRYSYRYDIGSEEWVLISSATNGYEKNISLAKLILDEIVNTNPSPITAVSRVNFPSGTDSQTKLVVHKGRILSLKEAKWEIEFLYRRKFRDVALHKQRDGSNLILGVP